MKENVFRKRKLFVLIAVTISLLFLVAGCQSNSPAQKGYKKIKEEIVDSLYLPDSFEVQSVSCYEGILQNYDVGAKYPFQYKITYKSKNRLGMDLYSVEYFGYNDETGSIKKYGEDSKEYDSAKSLGTEQKVKK